MACPHGVSPTSACPTCSMLTTYPTISTSGSTTTAWIPMPSDHSLMEAVRLRKELEERDRMVHELMSKEVEWQERIDALEKENQSLRAAFAEALDLTERANALLRDVLHGDAEWVSYPKN